MEATTINDEAKEALERFSAALAELLNSSIRSAYAAIFTGDLQGQLMYPTGDGPFAAQDLLALAERIGVALEDDAPDEGILLVLGRENFDTSILDMATSPGDPTSYDFCSQEAFLNLWLFGVRPDYYPGDPRIADHPGLSYVAERSIDWPWPSTRYLGESTLQPDTESWEESSRLREEFGYNVRKNGPGRAMRRRILDKAVPLLSLEWIANHLAWQVRMAKGRDDERYDKSISKWEEDLAYLKSTYYDGGFVWPHTGN